MAKKSKKKSELPVSSELSTDAGEFSPTPLEDTPQDESGPDEESAASAPEFAPEREPTTEPIMLVFEEPADMAALSQEALVKRKEELTDEQKASIATHGHA